MKSENESEEEIDEYFSYIKAPKVMEDDTAKNKPSKVNNEQVCYTRYYSLLAKKGYIYSTFCK